MGNLEFDNWIYIVKVALFSFIELLRLQIEIFYPDEY